MDPQQQHQNMNSGGLARYRSTPSYFANLMSHSSYFEDDCDQFLNPRVSSPELDRFFSRFMSTCAGEEANSPNLGDWVGGNSLVNESVFEVQTPFVAPAAMKNEPDVINAHQQQKQQQQMVYQSQAQLDHKPPVAANSGLENSYNVASTMGMDGLPQMKMCSGGGGSNSNLIRHSSSPAGLFANINAENGYAVMRGMGHCGSGSDANTEVSFSSGSRLKNQSDFPQGSTPSSGIMPHSVEIGGRIIGIGSPESGSFGDSRTNDGGYMTAGFPSTSWDDSTLISDNFLKGFAENQSNEGGNRTPSVLVHHLSLPTSSAEMSAMEKLLQFQDSVPLKIRAKRGCATHPRSIAERVRRTRISERMRKLQELVPNMDKQTNTADMLDLAVDYIKDLQKQVKTLSDIRVKCTCSNNEKS